MKQSGEANVADAFHFAKHLRNIVKPVLAEYGFGLEGARFLRYQDGFSDEFWFQRSQLNSSGAGHRFFLNVETIHGEGIPSRSPIPPRRPEGVVRLPRPPHGAYSASIWWMYASEQDLIELLEEASRQLVERGLPCLDRLHDLIRRNAPRDEFLAVNMEYLKG